MSIKDDVNYNIERDWNEEYEGFGDHMKSKYIVNRSIVYMVKGSTTKCKQQPIGFLYQVVQSSLVCWKHKWCSVWIRLLLWALIEVVTYDQRSNNRSGFQNLLCVSAAKPYFVYGNNKYFVLYDPSHLRKMVGNNLNKHSYPVGSSDEDIQDDKVCCKHIVNLYQADSNLPIRMAPKLTKQHVELRTFSHMIVILAAQCLSHSVSAGITTIVSQARGAMS